MSVLMTLRVAADAKLLEEMAAANPTVLTGIVARAKEHGVISHRFYGTEEEVMVLDEWESEAGFRAFFESSPEIAEMMAKVGATAAPEITFWRALDTGDAI